MKKLLLFLLLFVYLIADAQEQFPILHQRPADFKNLSAPDSLGVRSPLKRPDNNSNKKQLQQQNLPYPILFIHGLNSNSETWNTFTNTLDANYNLTFGGRIDYCLNYDLSADYTNTNFYPTPDADLALFTDYNTDLIVGDYYYLNFDVGYNGSFHPTGSSSDYIYSNQSAIAKQGIAVKWAINCVLQKTGRDKVILMGHSMGGLASREYLQNPANWQSDGQHHVAKLVTTGTPHGGSNSSGFGLSSALTGLDERSEAVRDLRRTYFYSGDNGVYLFGGLEYQNNSTNMDDNANISGIDFHNVDVNCNGVTGETIVGLNQKNIYTDLDYSCIIGECSGCILDVSQGDGVVNETSANLTNYYPGLDAGVFYYTASAVSQIHTDLPSQYYENMEGLDEPNEYKLAYNIDFNTTYTGFTTTQPNGGYFYDYDDYSFTLLSNTKVTVSVSAFSILSDVSVYILNSNYQILDSASHNIGDPQGIIFSSNLISGKYYLEIVATPTSTSYLYPYQFILNKTPLIPTEVKAEENSHELFIYPNPATTKLNLVGISGKTVAKIYDLVGKLVKEIELETESVLDVSDIGEGIYTLTTESANAKTFNKVVITK